MRIKNKTTQKNTTDEDNHIQNALKYKHIYASDQELNKKKDDIKNISKINKTKF